MVLLPGCQCCQPPLLPECQWCEPGSTPDTVTVSLSNIHVRSADLIAVSITSCFGGGAVGRVTAPNGGPGSEGPVTAVAVVEPGSGYAKLGRVQPTVSASASGEGATFTVTLEQDADECGVDFWNVESVSVAGGTGYQDGEAVTFTLAEGGSEELSAAATIHTSRTEPTLTPSVAGGTGATFSLSLSSAGTPTVWSIASVSVTSGGSGYADGAAFGVSLGSGSYGWGLWESVRTGRTQPTLALSIDSATGSGGTLSATLAETTDYNDRPAWYVSAVTVDDAGSGYSLYDQIVLTITDGDGINSFGGYVTVDGNGAITSATVLDGGLYWKGNGVIEGVDVWDGGEYWGDDGIPTSVTVEQPGIYYREDAEEAPYVSDVAVTLTQGGGVIGYNPDGAAGAVVTAEVDDDTSSATFGQITAFTIDDGGDGYLAWGHEDSPLEWFNDKTFVLRRDAVSPCVYTNECDLTAPCRVQSSGIAFSLRDVFFPYAPVIGLSNNVIRNEPPVYPNCIVSTRLKGDAIISDCATLESSGGEIAYSPVQANPFGPQERTLVDEASATVTPGGVYTPAMRCDTITADGMNAVSTSIEWAGFTFNPPLGQPGPPFCYDQEWAACRPIPGKSGLCLIDNGTDRIDVAYNVFWKCSQPARKAIWEGGISGTYNVYIENPWGPEYPKIMRPNRYFAGTWAYFSLSADEVYPSGTVTIPVTVNVYDPLDPAAPPTQEIDNVTITFTAPP